MTSSVRKLEPKVLMLSAIYVLEFFTLGIQNELEALRDICKSHFDVGFCLFISIEFMNASWKHLTNTDNGVHCSISILHQFRQVLIESGVNLYSEKDQNCNYHFDNGVHDRAISVLKWVKILVIIMGLANASWQDCYNFDLFKNGNSPSANPTIKNGSYKKFGYKCLLVKQYC